MPRASAPKSPLKAAQALIIAPRSFIRRRFYDNYGKLTIRLLSTSLGTSWTSNDGSDYFIPSSLYYDNFWHGWADSQTAKDGFPISSVAPELLLSRSRDRRCGL